jgi:hypothetical protein
MNNLPAAADLLAIARKTLLEELLPAATGEARYAMLMIANAMAIAARECEAGEGGAVLALSRLDALYGAAARDLTGEALQKALAEREIELKADIRRGAFDAEDGRRRALVAHLKAAIESRLRISSPKTLASAGNGA